MVTVTQGETKDCEREGITIMNTDKITALEAEKKAILIQSIAWMVRQSKKTKIVEQLNGEEEMLKQVWLPEWIVSELEGIEEFLRSASEHEKS